MKILFHGRLKILMVKKLFIIIIITKILNSGLKSPLDVRYEQESDPIRNFDPFTVKKRLWFPPTKVPKSQDISGNSLSKQNVYDGNLFTIIKIQSKIIYSTQILQILYKLIIYRFIILTSEFFIFNMPF